ncbi:hypothetical protein [Methylophilus sp. 5]|uniref:hypothetical protein n=1 Tax=Methylophilus sp. 5 TaxID=1112274 RepID=UPI000490CC2F|nr:hypothetical protein [Methylophilus sp. 5]
MMRRGLVWAALACTLLACWWVEQAEQVPAAATVATVKHAPQRRVTLAQVMPEQHLPPSPVVVTTVATVDEAAINLFAPLEMPTAEAAASQPPAAVNPYTYAGRLQEDGRWIVFLTDGQQQYVLHAGDRFAEGWQVALLDQQKIVLQHAAERFEIRLDNGVVF